MGSRNFGIFSTKRAAGFLAVALIAFCLSSSFLSSFCSPSLNKYEAFLINASEASYIFINSLLAVFLLLGLWLKLNLQKLAQVTPLSICVIFLYNNTKFIPVLKFNAGKRGFCI